MLLEVRGVSKRFGGVQALHDASLSVRRGEIHCLAGENGSGKSTLIKIIAGVHRPDAGRITFAGAPAAHLRPIDALRAGIQVMHQDLSLFPDLSAAENIALPSLLEHRQRVTRPARMRARARGALDTLGASIDPSCPVGLLPVAGKQLVAIARALLADAQLIIMDEPTTALTHREVDTLFACIARLKRRGISILFVSHKLAEVLRLAERITVLRNGATVAEGAADGFSHDALVRHMTGRGAGAARRRTPPTPSRAPPALRVTALRRRGAFEDVAFGVARGEMLGITGLLGCGKGELARALFGLPPAEAGTIEVDGRPARIACPRDAIRAGIGRVPEDRLGEGLFAARPVDWNITCTTLERIANRCRLVLPRAVREAALRWVDALGITPPAPSLAAENLSGGNQQKVMLARWLSAGTRVLVIQGPTAGVDVGAKTDIHRLLHAHAARGAALVMVSDDIPELAGTCDRVLLMHRGRIAAQFEGDALCESDLLAHMQALE